jgi:hypothetical protein
MSERTKLVSKLDAIFSKYVRKRLVDANGFGVCFTCGKSKHWSEVDAGHFQSRMKMSTRWDERNVQFQCKGCNMTNGGQQYTFGIKLDEVYGEGTAQEILVKSQQILKFSISDLRELIELYKRKVDELG